MNDIDEKPARNRAEFSDSPAPMLIVEAPTTKAVVIATLCALAAMALTIFVITVLLD